MDKLKYCPFCGGEAKRAHYETDDIHCVYCTSCLAHTTMMPTEEEAVAAWNNRYKAHVRIMRRGRKV